jgi:hypothetical protein
VPKHMASVPWDFRRHSSGVRCAIAKEWPPGQREPPGGRAHRRTVGPAIPRPVASPQSRTPLHRTTSGYQKIALSGLRGLTRSEVAMGACLRCGACPGLVPGRRARLSRVPPAPRQPPPWGVGRSSDRPDPLPVLPEHPRVSMRTRGSQTPMPMPPPHRGQRSWYISACPLRSGSGGAGSRSARARRWPARRSSRGNQDTADDRQYRLHNYAPPRSLRSSPPSGLAPPFGHAGRRPEGMAPPTCYLNASERMPISSEEWARADRLVGCLVVRPPYEGNADKRPVFAKENPPGGKRETGEVLSFFPRNACNEPTGPP